VYSTLRRNAEIDATISPAHTRRMAKKAAAKSSGGASVPASRLKSSALVDTRVIYCGDNLDQLNKLSDTLDQIFGENNFQLSSFLPS